MVDERFYFWCDICDQPPKEVHHIIDGSFLFHNFVARCHDAEIFFQIHIGPGRYYDDNPKSHFTVFRKGNETK
jgi:hypothetical protein